MLRYGLDNRYCKVDTYVHIFRSFINVIIKGAKWNLKEAVHNPGWDKYAHRGSFWGKEALVTTHLSFPNLDLRQGKKQAVYMHWIHCPVWRPWLLIIHFSNANIILCYNVSTKNIFTSLVCTVITSFQKYLHENRYYSSKNIKKTLIGKSKKSISWMFLYIFFFKIENWLSSFI